MYSLIYRRLKVQGWCIVPEQASWVEASSLCWAGGWANMGLASTKVPICSNKAALVVMENRLPNFISRRQRIRNEGKGKGGKGKEERKEECGSGSKKRCSWFYLTCATIKEHVLHDYYKYRDCPWPSQANPTAESANPALSNSLSNALPSTL